MIFRPVAFERRPSRAKVWEPSDSLVCVRGLHRHSPHSRDTTGPESPHRRIAMKALKNLLVGLVKGEQGGEVLEYAVIAGLIVVAGIAVIGAVGNKVLARWTSLNSSM